MEQNENPVKWYRKERKKKRKKVTEITGLLCKLMSPSRLPIRSHHRSERQTHPLAPGRRWSRQHAAPAAAGTAEPATIQSATGAHIDARASRRAKVVVVGFGRCRCRCRSGLAESAGARLVSQAGPRSRARGDEVAVGASTRYRRVVAIAEATGRPGRWRVFLAERAGHRNPRPERR